ncbi:phage antirepressor KilAC domain-containing protein [bacterium]|nr:phage antirepressor KilAC domain-containing protein [bacterium]
MQNEIQLFQYHANNVRTILMDGKPWFITKDVCEILSINNYRDATAKLPDHQKGVVDTDTLGGKQKMSVVNEAGLYRIIFSSRKEDAMLFSNWVVEEVLPSIRQTGSYSLKQVEITSGFLQQVADQLREQENQIKELKPKAEFFDAVANSKSAIPIGNVAKILEIPGIGRNILFQILRDQGILMHDNVPYQQFIDRGYFRVIEQKYTTPEGETKISIKTLVYQKGIEYIRKVVKLNHRELSFNASRLIDETLNQPPSLLQVNGQ